MEPVSLQIDHRRQRVNTAAGAIAELDQVARIAPFDAVPLNVADWWPPSPG